MYVCILDLDYMTNYVMCLEDGLLVCGTFSDEV